MYSLFSSPILQLHVSQGYHVSESLNKLALLWCHCSAFHHADCGESLSEKGAETGPHLEGTFDKDASTLDKGTMEPEEVEKETGG